MPLSRGMFATVSKHRRQRSSYIPISSLLSISFMVKSGKNVSDGPLTATEARIESAGLAYRTIVRSCVQAPI
jgi:hypothetical protein